MPALLMSSPFGKYVLLRRLAVGGMGEVFLARLQTPAVAKPVPPELNAPPERLVIKRILPQLAEDSEFRDMFLDEARIAAQLNHPNLVRIFEVGEVGDAVYLAMEYVHGEDLRSVERAAKQRGVQIPLRTASRIVAAAAAGLEHAHGLTDAQGRSLNLVHRDVSPQNILVGFAGEVKVIDFGVAKAVGLGQPTITGVLKGKCAYMSPEQAAGEVIDARSDVFSLGVVWWEMLTGRRLFKGSTDQMTMRLVLNCQVPPPSRLNPRLPKIADQLAARVLSKEAAARFPDARSWRLALEALDKQLGPAEPGGVSGTLVQQLFPERFAADAASFPEEETEPEGSDEFTGPSNLPGSIPKPGAISLPAWEADAKEENTVSVSLVPTRPLWHWAAVLTVLGLIVAAALAILLHQR